MVSEHINKSIGRFIRGEKKKPSSERAYFLQKICENIFADQKQFKKILGATKLFTVDDVHQTLSMCYSKVKCQHSIKFYQ